MSAWLKDEHLELIKKLGLFFTDDNITNYSTLLTKEEMSDLVGFRAKLMTEWQEAVGGKEALEAGAGAAAHDGPWYYLCKHVFGRRLLWKVKKQKELTGSNCAAALKNKSDMNIVCKSFRRFDCIFLIILLATHFRPPLLLLLRWAYGDDFKNHHVAKVLMDAERTRKSPFISFIHALIMLQEF